MSLSARRAWIEIPSVLLMCSQSLSLSARRAWIEILCEWRTYQAGEVALRKESVDRNGNTAPRWKPPRKVALRKESVDRN